VDLAFLSSKLTRSLISRERSGSNFLFLVKWSWTEHMDILYPYVT